MDFGTFHLHSAPADRPSRTIVHEHFQQMLAADRLGFAEVWIAEHNAREYGFIGNSVIVAAALAAATTRIRIGTAVTRLPVHNPLHLAEDLAYADILSGGRVDWGVGKGYDEHEFTTYGVNFAEREERWEETFNAVRQMWSTGRTAYNGRFYSLGDGQLIPLPQQDPLPTYIMVSGSERSVTWAAERLLPIVIGSGPGWTTCAPGLSCTPRRPNGTATPARTSKRRSPRPGRCGRCTSRRPTSRPSENSSAGLCGT